jgi:hypothetical protein
MEGPNDTLQNVFERLPQARRSFLSHRGTRSRAQLCIRGEFPVRLRKANSAKYQLARVRVVPCVWSTLVETAHGSINMASTIRILKNNGFSCYGALL